MTESRETPDSLFERCRPEVFDPQPSDWKDEWQKIKDDILAIEEAQFKEPSSQKFIKNIFHAPGTTVVLLRDTATNKIVGFRYSIPLRNYAAGNGENYRSDIKRDDEGKKTAYILNTALHPDYIGHRLSSKLITHLDAHLKQKNYKFVELDATINRNYAENVVRYNRDRVVAGPITHPSSRGPEVFLRIRL